MTLARILDALARLDPASPQCSPLRRQGGQLLLKMLMRDGLRSVERAIAALRRFQLLEKGPGRRTWREASEGRQLEIYVVANRVYRVASLRYRAPVQKPKPHPMHELFYSRYMAIGQKVYGNAKARVSADDLRVLLVGELEADVNNGGFSQYLGNKGRRRARAALRALEAIGARRTAGMLRKALEPGTKLDALDRRFYSGPEDLAMLAARKLISPRQR